MNDGPMISKNSAVILTNLVFYFKLQKTEDFNQI